MSLDRSIALLRAALLDGTYSPTPPTRFEVAKGKGAFRVLTSLSIRDAIVYRPIADQALDKAIPSKVPGAFFSRRFAATPVGKTLTLDDEAYPRFWDIWIRYQEYRSRTLLAAPYEFVVTSDITNYFDSIQHDLLLEYLAPIGMPRKAVGLLGRILEAYKPESGHSPSPRVGIAVDELDCSRELAHVFLLEHDWRVVSEVGADNYVRWMDDQNIGARSRSHARRIVNLLTRSLASQRLTLNAGKTAFLDPAAVRLHFQLDANEAITAWEDSHKSISARTIVRARRSLERVWRQVRRGRHVERGNWDKVLKRMYAAAIVTNYGALESRALRDLINYPDLDQRIFEYFARRNRSAGLYHLFDRYLRAGESLFEATEAAFFEAACNLSPRARERDLLIDLALAFAAGRVTQASGRPLGRASALLFLYRFAPERLHALYSPDEALRLPKEVARMWLAGCAAIGHDDLELAQRALLGHQSDDVARLSRFLEDVLAGSVVGLGKYKALRSRWPLSGKYYDTRTWLILDVASHSPNARLRTQLRQDLRSFQGVTRLPFERRVLANARVRLA